MALCLTREAYWIRRATEYSRLLDGISMDIVLTHELNTDGMCIAVSTTFPLLCVYDGLEFAQGPFKCVYLGTYIPVRIDRGPATQASNDYTYWSH